MKKETKKSILFYAASALLYMASLISFISGMIILWLLYGCVLVHHFFALARRIFV